MSDGLQLAAGGHDNFFKYLEASIKFKALER
jgi:hypothetical protein